MHSDGRQVEAKGRSLDSIGVAHGRDEKGALVVQVEVS